MEADGRIPALDLLGSLYDQPHALGLPAANVQVAADALVRRADLSLGLFHQRDDFLGALAQQHPLLGQRDTTLTA